MTAQSMSLKTYIWGVRILTVLAFGSWVMIVIAVDPEQASLYSQAVFFVSLFATLTGLFTLLFSAFYRKALGDTGALHNIGVAFRQAILLSLLGVALAAFRAAGLLTWWIGLLLVAAVLLLEITWRSFSRDR